VRVWPSCSALLWPALLLAGPAQELPRGAVSAKVACRGDASQSYALYLPSTYSRDRKWPILYAFDAGARGELAVQRFSDAAERYGLIVVASNNSRNGPTEIAQNALNAMLADTRARFPLAAGQVYVAGFSGGARVAVMVGMAMKEDVAGVIGFGAGFPAGMPTVSVPFAYFSAAGTDDFNYPELRDLDRVLEDLGSPHRFEVFEGAHEWPAEAVCTRAIEWMELQAMKSGRRARDAALVERLYASALDEAASEERAGHAYQAFSRYAAAAKDFAGLHDVSTCERKARQLQPSPDVKQMLADLAASVDQQQRVAMRIVRLSDAITGRNPGPAARDLLDLVADLKIKADGPGSRVDRMVARRLLAGVWVQFNELTSADFERKEYASAAARLRVMAAMRPDSARAEYLLARACARAGNSQEALEALQRAVAKGFTDAAALRSEADLDSIRREATFQRILESIKRDP